MGRRFLWIMWALILIAAPPAIQAAPITYDFSGTLPWAVDGTKQFTGSFTFDSNPIVIGNYDKYATETGTAVSIVLDVAGHEIQFSNAKLTVTQQWSSTIPGASRDGVSVTAGPGNDPSLTGISLGFANQADTLFSNVAPGLPIDLRNFNFTAPNVTAPPDMSVAFVYGQTITTGTITSVEPAPVPEPSMLIIFAGMGMAATTYARRRRRESGAGGPVGPEPASSPS